MRRFLLFIALGTFAVHAAGAAEEDLAALANAQARWQASAVSAYVYGYHKQCECYRDTPPETVVTVVGDTITRVYLKYDNSDREVPAREGSLGEYWTIDDLFAKLADAIERDMIVRVEYHATEGYPVSLYIDYDPDFDGYETDLELTRFERL